MDTFTLAARDCRHMLAPPTQDPCAAQVVMNEIGSSLVPLACGNRGRTYPYHAR